MTTYYIRKSGSDASAGTSAGAAWLTIGKAILAGGATSGDTVYIGAGTYREALVVGITPASTVGLVGDVDGSHTGDAGEVRWTAFTTSDITTPGAQPCRLNGKSYLSFSNIHFCGGSSGNGTCIDGQSVTGSHDIAFTRCAFTDGTNQGAFQVRLTGVVDTAFNYTFDSCLFGPAGNAGQVAITGPTSTIADYATGVVFKNCVLIGVPGGSAGGGLSFPASGANAFKPGGAVVINCTLIAAKIVSVGGSTAIPILLSNTIFDYEASAANCIDGNGQPNIVEDYNIVWQGASVERNGVSQGSFSPTIQLTSSKLLSYGQEWLWGGQPRPFGTPLAGSPVLGWSNAALASGRTPTCTDDATVGSIAWTTPSNASVPDGTSTTATAIPATTGVSHYLMAQGFTGFAGIPADATIKSIRVEVLALASGNLSVSASSVKLLKAGAIVGNDLAASNTTTFPTSTSGAGWPFSYGTSADPLWGTTWTVAQVQAAGFGCVFAAKNVNAATRNCTVDFLRVIVCYTLADGSGGVTVDMLGGPRPAGGGSLLYAAGALERGNTATVQSGTARSGSAWQIAGPGYQDFRSNVDAASVTLGVWARYDTASQQPTVTLLAAPELGIPADVALTWSDPGVNTWAQFTTTLVPTAAGVIRVRLATAVGTGSAFFDDVSFT